MIFATGGRIRKMRKKTQISQVDLAEALGISPAYINLIEAGKRRVSAPLLDRIAEALGADIHELDGSRDQHLIHELREATLRPEIRSLDLSLQDADRLVAEFPDWAEALLVLRRAYEDQEARTHALSDRLNQDPVLQETFYQIVSGISAIRSIADILDTDSDLERHQTARFQSMIATQAEGLSKVAETLSSFFEATAPKTERISAAEEVDDFLLYHNNYFAELENTADEIRKNHHGLGGKGAHLHVIETLASQDARSYIAEPQRRFQEAQEIAKIQASSAIQDILERYGPLSDEALKRATRALETYTAGAILFPYDMFLKDAEHTAYDLELLGQIYHASFEQICHRLTTLRAPSNSAIPFGFMRVNPAGYVTKRYPIAGLPIARYGPGCPLWAAYRAFQNPGHIVRQVAEFPNEERFFFVAKAIQKKAIGFQKAPHYVSVMLACDEQLADRLVYYREKSDQSDVTRVEAGPNCRLCPRKACDHRAEDHIISRV